MRARCVSMACSDACAFMPASCLSSLRTFSAAASSRCRLLTSAACPACGGRPIVSCALMLLPMDHISPSGHCPTSLMHVSAVTHASQQV